MSTMQLRSLPGSALDARRQPLRPVAPARCSFLPVRAVLPSSRPTVTARAVPGGASQPGIPSDYNRPPGGIPPSSIVIEGPITSTGGPGSGQRPVPRTGGGGGGSGGSSGGSGGSGGSSGPSSGAGGSSSGGGLPGGWSWDRVFLTLLGIALAVPAWKYVNRRFINKPEPEHTLTKVEDKAAEVKHRNAVGKAVHNVKEHTIEPVAAAVGAGVQAVKHNDIVRGVQHKAEEAKDAIDTGLHGAGHKAEHNAYKAKKETKHAADHAAEKADEAKHKAGNKAHEAAVKGGRALQHGKEKVGDAVYGAEAATGKATKSMLENIKGAAHTVGRKLHVVADSTEKGMKKGADKAEKATGTKHTGLPSSDNSDRTKAYVIGGTVIGTGVLAAAIYYWDRNGGDVKGKLNKFQGHAKDATNKALNRAQQASEPAKPSNTTSNTTSYKPPSATA